MSEATLGRTFSDDAAVMICRTPQPRDLAHAVRDGWYRIPCDRAPRRLAVDLLAFYQPASFGAARHRIEWVAPLERIDVAVRRAMLPDEPWHPRAAAPYWILRLGAPMALPEPLVSQRLRRFSFRYTQWWWLLCAGDVANSGSAAPAVPAAAPWW
jgi:hypothetical protein